MFDFTAFIYGGFSKLDYEFCTEEIASSGTNYLFPRSQNSRSMKTLQERSRGCE